MSKNRVLPTNLLHFGYNPTDSKDVRFVALKNATEYYAFQTVVKKLEQLEADFKHDLASDKAYVSELEIAARLPPPPPKIVETIYDKIMELESTGLDDNLSFSIFIDL